MTVKEKYVLNIEKIFKLQAKINALNTIQEKHLSELLYQQFGYKLNDKVEVEVNGKITEGNVAVIFADVLGNIKEVRIDYDGCHIFVSPKSLIHNEAVETLNKKEIVNE